MALRFLTRTIYVIYGIFAGILIINYITDFRNNYYIYLLFGLLVLCLAGTFILAKGSSLLQHFNEKKIFIVLLIICFAVKMAWVYFIRIEPLVDYATFYYTAKSLSDSFVIHNRYVALFPHIFGYASFLSIFFKIFGTSYLVPPIINVFLSTISMGLIFFLCKRISGYRTAIIASLLWIIFPSQTIYNMFVLSEPLYCTFLLLAWTVIEVINEKLTRINIKKLLIYAVFLALLFTLMNMARPIAAVPLIALAIWIFVVDTRHISHKKMFSKKTIYVVTVIISYFILSNLANHYISARLGEKIATVPGYNIYVGLNMESLGRWNEPDSALLFHYNDLKGWTAEDAQKQMLEEAKKRLQSGNIDFPKLFYNKFLIFLGDDSAAAGYGNPVLHHAVRYSIILNIFYYFLISASLFGALVAFKNKNKSPVFFICLYLIGLTLAQMVVEVAARYHYSATIPMVLLAALGISHFDVARKDGNFKRETIPVQKDL
ncbi:glycosyltransferase family 39 protein [Bacillus sp. EB600]|uniref:glycosyltransferase family 39 protein n=1 Tax=Bacillus sp. EB600 TaxID=2806345 RepID=UPI00210B27BA|nr:glycosyltransferase family 39 protein [Bacillus sp. EB600]MCQ6278673.1 glycosyltransferase family 39 protein [Bacillus sp. EB600]